jgi:hypothetical protein
MDMKFLRTIGVASVLAAATALLVSMQVTRVDAGSTEGVWSEPVMVDPSQDGHGQPTDVSCASRNFCVLVDAAGFFSIYRHMAWSAPVTLDPGGEFTSIFDMSVSCVSNTFCVAVGSNASGPDSTGIASLFDGSSWSDPVIIDDFGLRDVSCTSLSFCYAVDSDGSVLNYDGTGWSTPRKIVRADEALNAVSCLSTFCMAVDDGGHGYTYGDGSWSRPTRPVKGAAIDVACLNGGRYKDCLIIDDLGRSHFWLGGVGMGAARGHGYQAASCHTEWFCMALMGGGRTRPFDGINWGERVTVDKGHPLSSVSCPSTRFCAAVDSDGRAIIYTGT